MHAVEDSEPVGQGEAEALVAEPAEGMIPARRERPAAEVLFVRLIASAGIAGIGVAIAAIMSSQHSHGWLVGLVVSIVSMALAAILWSSRRL